MKKNYYDESVMIEAQPGELRKDESSDIIENAIRSICQRELFGVLATEGKDQPYANLISFASTEDLRHIVFSTPIGTRKYSFIKAHEKVSVLIDTRSEGIRNLNKISAVTAIGKARLVEGEEGKEWETLLIEKHPNLEQFVKSETTSTIVIEVSSYIYVRRFQEVFQWTLIQK